MAETVRWPKLNPIIRRLGLLPHRLGYRDEELGLIFRRRFKGRLGTSVSWTAYKGELVLGEAKLLTDLVNDTRWAEARRKAEREGDET